MEKIDLKDANIPYDWKLYQSNEDSFFDCVSEALKNIKPKLKCTSDTLRVHVKNLVKKLVNENRTGIEEVLKIRENFVSIKDYLDNIEYNPQVATVFHINEPILGHPYIEGYLICVIFDIQLHILVQDENNKYKDIILSKDHSERGNNVSYDNKSCIHIVQQKSENQFYAILKNKIETLTEKQSSTKRAGTLNHGFDYENGMVALLAIRCALNTNIKDFTIETNVDGYGAFDDIVLNIKFEDRQTMCGFQLKHKHSASSFRGAFEDKNGLFYLKRYEESYLKLKNSNNSHLILFTNAKISGKRLDGFDSISDFDFLTSLIDTNPQKSKIYRVEKDEFDRNFLSKLLIFTEQINASQIHRFLKCELNKLLGLSDLSIEETCILKIQNCFTVWNKSSTVITKHKVKNLLFETVLSPYLHLCVSQQITVEYYNVVTETFSAFNSSYVLEKNADVLQNSIVNFIQICFEKINLKINSLSVDLDNKSLDIIYDKKNTEFQEYREHFNEIRKINNNITHKDVYLMICRLKRVPLLVRYNQQNEKIVRSVLVALEEIYLERSVVLVKEDANLEEVQLQNSFKNLFQLKDNYNKMLDENQRFIKVFLKSNEHFLTLHDLKNKSVIDSKNEKDLMETINPDAYLALISEGFNVEDKVYTINDYFNRTLQIPHLERAVLDNLQLKFYIITNSNSTYYKSANVEIIVNEDISKIKANIETSKQSCLICREKDENYLRLIYINKPYQLKKCFFEEIGEDEINDILTENRICTLSAPAGMGKTTLLRRYQYFNQAKSICRFINLCKHMKYIEKINTLEDSEDIKILFKIFGWTVNDSTYKFRECLFKYFIENGQITWLLDGFDEVDKAKVKNFINCVKNTTCKILVATRTSRQLNVEEIFNVLCINLKPFSEQNQKEYLKNIQIDVIKNKNLFEIPLHINLAVKLYKENSSSKYDEFNILHLLEYFLKKNIRSDDYYEKVSKLSLTVFFYQNLLNTVGLYFDEYETNIKSLKENENKNSIFGISANNEPTFTHRIYVEYLCAKWLVKKLQNKKSRKMYLPLYQKLFCTQLSQVRLFLDNIISKDLKLHCAVLNRDLTAVKKIVEENEDLLNETDEFGRTALHLLASYGRRTVIYTKNEVDGVKTGGNYSEITLKDDNYELKLPAIVENSVVRPSEILKFLLEKGIKNTTDNLLKVDAIVYALKSRSLENANILCGKFQAPDKINLYLIKTCLPLIVYWSIKHSLNDLFNYISERIDSSIVTMKYNGRNLLFVAVENNNKEILQKLYDVGVDIEEKFNGKPILEFVDDRDQFITGNMLVLILRDHKTKKILKLIESEKSFDINGVDEDNETPLYFAAANGNLKLLNKLIEKGADYHSIARKERNLLHAAAQSGNVEVFERLLELGLYINFQDEKQVRPIHMAVRKGHLKVLELILEKGANWEKPAWKQRNLLHYSCESDNCDMLEEVLKMGFSINSVDEDKATPLHLAASFGSYKVLNKLITRGADWKLLDNKKDNLLHYSSLSNNVEVLERVLNLGFKINETNEDGATALHLAAWSGSLNTLNALIEKGADFKMLDLNGQTLLHYAAYKDNTAVLDRILNLGLDIDSKDKEGLKPTDIAETNSNSNVLRTLKSLQSKNIS